MRDIMDILDEAPASPLMDDSTKAKIIHSKALRMADRFGRLDISIRKGWDKVWVEAFNKVVIEQEVTHHASQAEEAQYAVDDSVEHLPRPFDMKAVLPDALNIVWQNIKPTIDIMEDATYDLKRYMRDHPNTVSDEMSRLQEEIRLGQHVAYDKAGLGHLDGMEVTLAALDSFAEAIDMYGSLGMHICTPATEKFITHGLPLILAYTKMIAVKAINESMGHNGGPSMLGNSTKKVDVDGQSVTVQFKDGEPWYVETMAALPNGSRLGKDSKRTIWHKDKQKPLTGIAAKAVDLAKNLG